MADHAWVLENIAGYLAEGLDAAERAEFETHTADCPACARAMEEARAVDQHLCALFADVRPRAGLEDRMIRHLRAPSDVVRKPFSLFGRVAVAAAAVVMVGILGGGMILAIDAAEGSDARAQNNLTQLSLHGHGIDVTGGVSRGDRLSVLESQTEPESRRLLTAEELATEARERTLARLDAGEKRSSRLRGHGAAVEMYGVLIENDEAGADPKVPTNYNLSIDQDARFSGAASDKAISYGGVARKGGEGRATNGTLIDNNKNSPSLPVSTAALPPPPADPNEGYGLSNGKTPGKDVSFDPFRRAEPMKEERKLKEVLKLELKPKPELTITAGVPMSTGAGLGNADPKVPEKKPEAEPAQAAVRKIIRTGEIEYEVDSFDTAVERIAKLVGDEKGFVTTVNSQKLSNGKVRGSVVVRVPPERLDTLLLKLRALGDLKTQRIGSRDVGKEFTDSESMLKANRAMEQRFLDIIKNGKGEIKDLIQAEKQLGEYRERIEKLEGELRYFNNQVGLSTLTITLVEREIRAAAGITESSTITMGIEVDDVEKAQQQAHAAVVEVKGRILKSELKQNGPGMYEAVIKFQVAPDAVGPLRDRLQKLGVVTRQDVGKKYEAEGGTERIPDTKVKREDVVVVLSLLNLANFAPRERVEIQLACLDAEAVYRAVLERAQKASARIVTQVLDRQPNDQTQGTVRFEVKTADADAVLADLKALGEVMRLQVVENVNPERANLENLSRSKRGFVVQLQALGTTIARETATIQVASRDVPASFKALKDAVVKAKARMLNASLNEQDRQNVAAQIDFEIRRADEADLTAALAGAGDVISRNVQRAPDTQPNVIDSKVQWKVTLINQANMKPRETWTLAVEVANVDQAASDFTAAVASAKGRTIDTRIDHQRNGQVTARLVFDVPFDQAATLADKFRAAGAVRLQEAVRNPQVPEGPLAIARIAVTVSNALPIVAGDQGIGISFRKSLGYSVTALSWIVTLIVVGLSVVLPLAAVGLGLRWLIRKLRGPVVESRPAL